jgi:catalase
MLFLTRMFGVTRSDAERDLASERACIEAITNKVLQMQAKAANEQHLPLRRGTHAKGTSARAQFEVFDVRVGRDPALAARLAKGIFAKPGVYPAIVRFGNADSKVNSDFKADVRSLSFSVDLTRDGSAVPADNCTRQDFSLQNTTTLPINDAHAFLATMKLLTASNPAAGLWALPFRVK